MYRILIADDEQKILQLILQLGHWEALEMEIVGTCSDGEEALRLIRALQPDIVLTDIKMPLYDGIQLIEKAREAGLDTHFIVLSGFKHFEYARNAIQLGVVDYLLKPLNEDQLNKTLEKTCRLIEAKKQSQSESQQLNDYLTRDRTQAQMKFLEALTLAASGTNTLPASVQECNAQYQTGFSAPLFRCAYLTTNLDNLLGGRESLFSEKMQESFQTLFPEPYCYVSFPQKSGVVLMVNYGIAQRDQVKQGISALYYGLKNLTEIYGNFVLNIGVSLEKDAINQLGDALEEATIAEWARMILMEDKVLAYDVIKGLPRFAITDILPREKELELKGYVKVFQAEGIGRLFAQIAATAAGYHSHYPGDIRGFFTHLEENLFPLHIAESGKTELTDIRNELALHYKRAKGFNECVKVFYVYLEAWLEAKRKQLQERKGRPIDEAQRYVKAHFAEPLYLEMVAEIVHLSPTYFCKLFKMETGVGFSEYLAGVRIEKAKALLLQTKGSIKDIALAVGYQDDKYFSKLFRKQVGIKPSEYKKLYLGHER